MTFQRHKPACQVDSHVTELQVSLQTVAVCLRRNNKSVNVPQAWGAEFNPQNHMKGQVPVCNPSVGEGGDRGKVGDCWQPSLA